MINVSDVLHGQQSEASFFQYDVLAFQQRISKYYKNVIIVYALYEQIQ